jgi:hypothetical protein
MRGRVLRCIKHKAPVPGFLIARLTVPQVIDLLLKMASIAARGWAIVLHTVMHSHTVKANNRLPVLRDYRSPFQIPSPNDPPMVVAANPGTIFPLNHLPGTA